MFFKNTAEKRNGQNISSRRLLCSSQALENAENPKFNLFKNVTSGFENNLDKKEALK